MRQLVAGNHVSREALWQWVLDTDHGLLHGFIAGFAGFWRQFPGGIPDEVFESIREPRGSFDSSTIWTRSPHVRFLAAVLVHDFARVILGDDGHDEALRQFFPELNEAVFHHSESSSSDLLAWSDRVELMRFHDWNEWADSRSKEAIVPYDLELLGFFYQRVRPALASLFAARCDTWMRHGVESPEVVMGSGKEVSSKGWTPDTPYPQDFFGPPRRDPETWAVEIGHLPFRRCLLHGRESFYPWGIMSVRDFRQHGGQLAPPLYEVDHLAARGEIPLRKWVFLIDLEHPRDAFVHDSDLLAASGGYIEYDGSANVLNIGVRDTSTDDDAIQIARSTGVATFDFGTINLATDALDLSGGSITNLAVGGLPDNTVDNGCMADDAISVAELATDSVTMDAVDADGAFTSLTGAWATTGLLSGGVVTNSKAAAYTIGTDNAAESYGGVIYVTGAAVITMPAVAAGMNFSVITIGAVAVSVKCNASDLMYLDGTITDDGDKATNTSTTGDSIVCTYYSGDGWYCMSGSPDGDNWTDTGA